MFRSIAYRPSVLHRKREMEESELIVFYKLMWQEIVRIASTIIQTEKHGRIDLKSTWTL